MMTLDQLLEALNDAEPYANGTVRFRFAVAYADYNGSPFADVDPFGPIRDVTITSDGTVLVDIVPELATVKQLGLAV